MAIWRNGKYYLAKWEDTILPPLHFTYHIHTKQETPIEFYSLSCPSQLSKDTFNPRNYS
jgi:hypothetical protein